MRSSAANIRHAPFAYRMLAGTHPAGEVITPAYEQLAATPRTPEVSQVNRIRGLSSRTPAV